MGISEAVAEDLFNEFVGRVDLAYSGLVYLWAVAKNHVDSELDLVKYVSDSESAEAYFSAIFNVCRLLLELQSGAE